VSFIGQSLRRVRAGHARSLWESAPLQGPETLTVTSAAFAPGGQIPAEAHRGEGAGANQSPPLAWSEVPSGTRQVLLVIDDTDVPLWRPLVHTVALLPAQTTSLAEGALTPEGGFAAFVPGTFGRVGYHGPRPIVGHGVHHYGFAVYALSVTVDHVTSVKELLAAVDGRVLARGRIIGTDQR